MDNFHIDLTSEGPEALRTAFSLLGGRAGRKVVGFRDDAEKGLVFYSSEASNMTKLPFAMDLAAAADFAHQWLMNAAVYGAEPDHDGSNGKGWRVYCEAYGHVGGQWQAFVAVQPAWAEYGK